MKRTERWAIATAVVAGGVVIGQRYLARLQNDEEAQRTLMHLGCSCVDWVKRIRVSPVKMTLPGSTKRRRKRRDVDAVAVPRYCDGCGVVLTGRRRRWCEDCSNVPRSERGQYDV